MYLQYIGDVHFIDHPCFWDITPIIFLILVAPTEEVCRNHDSAQLVGGWGWKKEFTNDY